MTNGHTTSNQYPDKTENLSFGYVKLFRSITKKSWYRKSEYVHLFTHLLLKAAHSGFETWFIGTTITLKPGQLITGRKKLSDETGINESKIERILKFFESEQQIEQRKTNSSRLITITNWNQYQKNEQQIEQPANNERTATEQRVNTIQEGKEDKKIKKGKKSDIGAIAKSEIDISKSNSFKQTLVPTKEKVLEKFLFAGGSVEMAEAFFNKYQSIGWRKSGSAIQDFSFLVPDFIRNWNQNDYNKESKTVDKIERDVMGVMGLRFRDNTLHETAGSLD